MNRHWSAEHDAILRAQYDKTPAKQIAVTLGRTVHAVWIRGRHLRLKKDRIAWDGVSPPPATIAYTAGIVDGEGSIQINPSSVRDGGKRYWRIGVAISMVSGDFIRCLRKDWSDIGGLTVWQPKLGRRPAWTWAISGASQAEWFLRTLLPFLRLKRAQAELALRFQELVVAFGGRLTPEASKARTDIAMAMRALNEQTGKAHATFVGVAA